MNRWTALLLLCFCPMLAAQPGQPEDGNENADAPKLEGKPTWPWVGGDLARTSVAAGPKIDRVPAIRWVLPLTPYRNSYCAPTCGHGRVLLPVGNNHSQPNRLVCVEAAAGRQLWSEESSGWLGSTAAGIGDGRAVLGAGDDQIRCYDLRTGEQQWTQMKGSHFWTDPLILDGTIYIACKDNVFYAVDLATGQDKWRFSGEGSSKSSPAMADGRVVFGQREKSVVCLSVRDGSKLWQFETDDWTDTPITIAGGLAFAGTKAGTVYAIDLAKGEKRWTFKTDGVLRGPFAVRDGLLLVGSRDGRLYALDAAKGELRWKFEAAGPITGGALIVGDLAYVADGGGQFAALRLADGGLLWKLKLGVAFLSAMAADGGGLYLVDDGEVDGPVIFDDYAMRKGARLLCLADGWDDPALLAAAIGRKAEGPDPRIARLIKLLGSEEFLVRESAEKQLEQIGAEAVPQLVEALQSTRDWEVRERAERLVGKLGAAKGGDAGELAGKLGLSHDVPYLLHWLAAADEPTRREVHARLGRIVDGLPPFDPGADAAARAAAAAELGAWWDRRKATLAWESAAGKYVAAPQK